MAPQNKIFEEVQRIVRWHYQWVVVFDYLEGHTLPESIHFRGLPPFWTVSWPFFFKISGPLTDALPGANHSKPDDRSLPRRNLLRGRALMLSSSQRVARRMGVQSGSILTSDEFGDETPLWYYVLKEAEVHS